MTHYSYIGSELELFREARNWKAYYRKLITPYLGQRVLEVGAGIGATTEVLCQGAQADWVCLEPDLDLLATLKAAISTQQLPGCCRAVSGTLATLPAEPQFDSVIYIDVLEHIADDRAEAERAAQSLKPGGHLIVLGPAHQWLYTPFDKAIGHYRRYSRPSLKAAIPAELSCLSLRYLDCVGLLASLANRLLLRQSMPTRQQIGLWDRAMVPLSQKLDPLLGYGVGKSVLGIWRK